MTEISGINDEGPSVTAPAITILLADTNGRDLARVFGPRSDIRRFKVIGEAGAGNDLAAIVGDLQPQIVILGNWIDTASDCRPASEDQVLRLRAAVPTVRIIVLTEPDRKCMIAAMNSGVSGLVDSARINDDLISALLRADSGEVYLSNSLMEYLTPGPKSSSRQPINPRERQLLRMVAEANTSGKIGVPLDPRLRTGESNTERKMRFLPGFFRKRESK